MKPGADEPGHEDELDDLEDDASLKAMRSVWLSMRDEEPSAGGLSALMAAATAKAAEMRPPSLWQRLGALLRRPPALAFATVLVLVGGAVVVSQQSRQAEPPMQAASEKAPGNAAVARAHEADETAVPAATPADPAPPAPAPPAAPVNQVARSGGGGGGGGKAKKPAKSAPAAKGGLLDAAPLDEGTAPSGAGLGNPAADDARAPVVAPAPKADLGTLRKAEPDAELESLERKARAAAASGDCGTVEQLMRKIARRDPQVGEQMRLRPEIRECLARMKSPSPSDR